MAKSLLDEIRDRQPRLSRVQKKLALYLLENWPEIPLLSIESIAEKAGVSTASVTRFARQFSHHGFYDFKERVKRDAFRKAFTPLDRFRLTNADLHGKQSLTRVAEQDVKNINKLLLSAPEESFNKLVALLEKSKRVYAFGVGISEIFSDIIAHIFNQIRKETYNLKNSVQPIEEKLLELTSDDLLILISLLPYSRRTIEYARLAREGNIPVIGISDNELSPLSRYATLMLAIPRENILFTSSISAFSVLVNAAAADIALKRKDDLIEWVKDSDRKLRRFYVNR
jgi:DNA-binding MurR/RpiR family transcriptional regulator